MDVQRLLPGSVWDNILHPAFELLTRFHTGRVAAGVPHQLGSAAKDQFVKDLINCYADTRQVGEKSLVELNFSSPVSAVAVSSHPTPPGLRGKSKKQLQYPGSGRGHGFFLRGSQSSNLPRLRGRIRWMMRRIIFVDLAFGLVAVIHIAQPNASDLV